MNRINISGLFLAGLMALTIAAPLYAGEAVASTESAQAESQAAEQKAEQKPAAQVPVSPAFGWLQSLSNGLNAIKQLFIPKVMSDTEKMVNGAQQAAVKFESAATKAGDAVTGAANEVKEGMKEIRGVFDGAKQMFANGLAATKLDGLMRDESVQALKQHAPLIFGVTVIGVALFAAVWMYKAELETLAGPLGRWMMAFGTPAPAAQ